jgi:hypothetical protein
MRDIAGYLNVGLPQRAASEWLAVKGNPYRQNRRNPVM